MRLVLVHARAQALELLRYPAASVPTLLFPALFFGLFGVPAAHDRANVLLAGFAAFAVLGVAFFQFGVGIAADRVSAWERFLRTLAVSPAARFAARVIVALGFAAGAAGGVVAVAAAATPIRFAQGDWALFAVALLAGSIPFALLGIAIGYWTSVKSALPIANVLYFVLAYAGGLWTPPSGLPGPVAAVSPFLPTRQWGDLLWAAALGRGLAPLHWLVLAGYAVAFGALAVAGYRRDEGEHFR